MSSDSPTPAPAEVRHRDGIAFTPGATPATGTWRALPEAPITYYDASSGAPTIDGSVYFLAPQALMQFDTTSDTWTRHDIPAESTGNWLHAAGDHLILTAAGFEDIPDYQWDHRTHEWSRVPTDPLGRAGRRAINTPHGFLLIAIDPDYARDDIGPRPLAAALLDIEAGTWQRLPSYRQLEGGQLTLNGNRVIDAVPLAGFTPEVGPYAGTQLPAAGVLTLPEGTWSTLPGAVGAADLTPGWSVEAAGEGLIATQGLLYDDRSRSWSSLPPPVDSRETSPGAVVWADDVLIALGASSGIPELGDTKVDTTARVYRPSVR
ncbi:hypothetical protein GTR02_21305 [Kineococcus sp. R8]|uniref:hypothetical protein n=1 Tax=Kineococcus siccus TaxID=2696567 RepID=UPI0014129CD5|nr:hypothetical protein [Kineococcus siccus]NAZ84343.1 hypothetical protein [Kineococcus siccus]